MRHFDHPMVTVIWILMGLLSAETARAESVIDESTDMGWLEVYKGFDPALVIRRDLVPAAGESKIFYREGEQVALARINPAWNDGCSYDLMQARVPAGTQLKIARIKPSWRPVGLPDETTFSIKKTRAILTIEFETNAYVSSMHCEEDVWWDANYSIENVLDHLGRGNAGAYWMALGRPKPSNASHLQDPPDGRSASDQASSGTDVLPRWAIQEDRADKAAVSERQIMGPAERGASAAAAL